MLDGASQGSVQPGRGFPCLKHLKVERWASVVSESDSKHCSPQLPWQLGKIRKPEEENLLFHWAGRSPAPNSSCACLPMCGSGPEAAPGWGAFYPGAPAALNGEKGGSWGLGSHRMVGSGPRLACARRRQSWPGFGERGTETPLPQVCLRHQVSWCC